MYSLFDVIGTINNIPLQNSVFGEIATDFQKFCKNNAHFWSEPPLPILPVLQNLQTSDCTTKTLELLANLNEIIASSQDELNFFHEIGGLHLILRLLHTDSKFVHICLKILLNASKRNEGFRKGLVKGKIFHFLSIQLKNEADSSRKNFILYTALIIILVHGNADAQEQIRTSGCLSYLVYILNTFLVDVETKPLPYKNTELLVYSIIASNKDPRHLENQTEVGWITPKIVEYLGKQTIFSDGDQIQIMKCFWSFLKAILHKNEFNQRIFLKCSGFIVLFRSMQEIVDEKKSEEFGDLLIKMTGVLIRLKSQKEFLYHASTYCSLMILRSLLNTYNIFVIQHVIIFLDSLTQEIPHTLQLAKGKKFLQSLMRAKVVLSKNTIGAELCQNIWDRTIISDVIPLEDNAFTSDSSFVSSLNKSDTLSELNYVKNQFCTIHDCDALQKSQFHSDYFFDFRRNEPSEYSKMSETSHVNIWATHLRNQLKERKVLKLGKMNSNRKTLGLTRITIRKIIQFFGKLRSFFF